jgi:myo-inositol 2-dehydrogenase/D-chiro-inositol 1-dehydrogenase
MRVGVIGSGRMAGVHTRNWAALGAEVRIHSRTGADQLASEHGLIAEGNRSALIAWADVIDICTPTTTHAELVHAAIAAGRGVVCEKPLARTADEARGIAVAAGRAGVSVYPAHVVRYVPEYSALRTAVVDGRIGDPLRLRFTRSGAGPPRAWFYEGAASGGLVMDQLIHDLDQARWLAGAVTEVHAVQQPPSNSGILPPEVTAEVTLTHASGARSQIRGAWGPPGTAFHSSFEVIGSHGTLQSLLAGQTGDGPYLEELREFAAAFAGGPQPRVSVEDGIVAVALAEAAGESIARGRPIPFDEAAVRRGALSDP